MSDPASGPGDAAHRVAIGGASAFWGDSITGALQLVDHPGINYLVFDYLAEVTMSILAGARIKNPELGYATDFVDQVVPAILEKCVQRRIRIVANAGGVNPRACARRLEALAREHGQTLRVAVVDGDDISGLADELRAAGTTDFYSGATMPRQLSSANAYLGAFPIARALAQGADVVVTGRVVDSALVLGILVHEFGWARHDYARLAQGSLAGHLIECGAQATGGLFTDWRSVPDWATIGYPVIECQADGSFVVTKPPGSGGAIRADALAEQLVYEIDDPARYILPDVVCDFRDVEMIALDDFRVEVRGARGGPPTTSYKVSATYLDGYRCVASLTLTGFAVRAKARRTGEALLTRTRHLFASSGLADYSACEIDAFGPGDDEAFGDAVLRLAVSHRQRAALELFAREVAAAGTSFAPGTTGSLVAGRPVVSPSIRLFTFLIDRARVSPRVHFQGAEETVVDVRPEAADETSVRQGSPPAPGAPVQSPVTDAAPTARRIKVPLIRIAHGRSGDKGDRSNIGLIARSPEAFEVLRRQITTEVVARHLSSWVKGPVARYEMPGIRAFNFVLENALGGGGMSSLRADPLGKAMAQRLLALEVEVDAALLDGLPDPG